MAPTPQDDDGRKTVSCPVCKELFLSPCIPKILPCGHTVCIKCLNTIGSPMSGIRCPLCMENHQVVGCSLPTNFIVQSCADKYHSTETKRGYDSQGTGGRCESYLLFFSITKSLPLSMNQSAD